MKVREEGEEKGTLLIIITYVGGEGFKRMGRLLDLGI